ncbi:hypothetical protein [Sporomusa aerivorans]|uniref:hypothetical protein n=1 Tax=Sporomusa aerivorans TaxID=204936 RepID=UPI00352AECBA
MKKHFCKIRCILPVLLLSLSVLLAGCANNLTPVEPQPQPPHTVTPPDGQTVPTPTNDVVVTYNYGAADKVQLSANNFKMKVGQRLILQPAPGVTKTTRFTSSGDNFWGDIMKQDTNQESTGKAVFTAVKAGKGKLQIIPNSTETARAVDLWVTVE